MSRNRKLRDQLRQKESAAAKASQDDPVQAVEPEDTANPLDAIMGDHERAELEQQQALEDDQAGELADGGDPEPEEDGTEEALAALRKQIEEAQSARKVAEDRLKEREAAEANFKAQAERERAAEREAAEARWREENTRRTELEDYRVKAERDQLISHKSVLEHALMASRADLDAAKRKYTEAMSNMDYAAAAEAQELISDVKFHERQLREGYEVLKDRIENPPPVEARQEPMRPRQEQHQPQPVQVSPQDQWEQAIAGYSERDKHWLRKNRDDLLANPERQQLAEAAHKLATLRYKLQPGTDDYYRFLDEEMGYAEPEDESVTDAPEPDPVPVRQQAPRQPAQRPRTPVVPAAPVSRPNVQGNAGGLTYATAEDKRIAADLGMSVSRYLARKQEISSGKSHLRFIHEGN